MPLTGYRGTDIVHHDLGAICRQTDRGCASNTASSTGHHRNLAIKHASHCVSS
jgi:hypothetical protein